MNNMQIINTHFYRYVKFNVLNLIILLFNFINNKIIKLRGGILNFIGAKILLNFKSSNKIDIISLLEMLLS